MSIDATPTRSVPSAEYTTALYGRQPVPAHKIIARNGKSVVGSGEPNTAATAPAKTDKPFSFWDLVDIINPLQHIPVVNTIYRKITGDEINGFARVAGGALFGGFAGAAVGMINAAMVDNTGKDMGDTVLSMFTGDDDKPAEPEIPAPVTVAAEEPGDVSQTSAKSGTANLFDGAPSPSDVTKKPAPHNMPIIEVRPEAKIDPTVMPPAKDVAALGAMDKDAPIEPKPVNKAQVQQAMMDALLKMQASHSSAIDDLTSDDKS